MVVFCPNIGILSAVVLSLIPLMRPFAWQSLLLPILPVQDKMLDLLEAPVPFIVGVKVSPFRTLAPTALLFCPPAFLVAQCDYGAGIARMLDNSLNAIPIDFDKHWVVRMDTQADKLVCPCAVQDS